MQLPGEQLVALLWESTICKGVSAFLRPWMIRRDGYARADVALRERLIAAQADYQGELIRKGAAKLGAANRDFTVISSNLWPVAGSDGEPTIDWAVLESVLHEGSVADRFREEVNVARALMRAEATLENESGPVPDDRVDEDWLFKWRDSAGKVSSEQMQDLWGRILAGEVKSPGSYSLRTLDLLKNVGQKEAKSIGLLAQFQVQGGIFNSASDVLEAAGIDFGFLLEMQEMGIVTGVDSKNLTLEIGSSVRDRFERPLISNDLVLVVRGTDANARIKFPCLRVTSVGKEIFQLAGAAGNRVYLQKVGEFLKSQNFTVELSRFTRTGPGSIELFDTLAL